MRVKTDRVKVDLIEEESAGAGITIDGVLVKDGLVDGVDVSSISGEILRLMLLLLPRITRMLMILLRMRRVL